MRSRIVPFFLASVGWATLASAQTIWEGDVSTSWNDPGNWSTGAVPTNLTDVVFDDTATPASPVSVDVNGSFSVRTLTFANATKDYTVGGPTNGTLTIADTAGPANLVKTGAATATLTSPVSATNLVTDVSAGTLTVSGDVTATAAITAGVSGGTFNLNGTTTTGGASAFTANVSGGTLNIGGPVTAGTNFTANVTGTGTLNVSGAVTAPTFDPQIAAGRTATFSGRITGPGATAANLSVGNNIAGTLVLSNSSSATPNLISSTNDFNVAAGGVLRAGVGQVSLTSGTGVQPVSSPLGSAGVTLNGGTLEITGTLRDGGLTGQFFSRANHAGSSNAISGNVDPDYNNLGRANARMNTRTLNVNNINGVTEREAFTNSNLDFASGFGGGAPFNTAPIGFTGVDNISTRMVGKVFVPGGDYTFSTRSDDGSMLFINGQLVVNNNAYQGATTRSNSPALSLAAGWHDIMVVFYEGGGGAGLQVSYSGTGVTSGIIPSTALRAVQGTVNLGNNVTVNNASSSVNVVDVLEARLGTLTMTDNGASPTLTNAGNGLARFGTTTFDGTGTSNTLNYTINAGGGGTLGDIALGQLVNGNPVLAGGVNITKTGAANLILDGASPVLAGLPFQINVNEGRLVATGTGSGSTLLNGMTVNLATGTTLQLRARDNNTQFGLTTLATTGNVTIEVGSDAPNAGRNVDFSVGGFNIGAGTASFDIFNNLTVTLNSSLAGAGDLVNVGPGVLRLSGANSADPAFGHSGDILVNRGTLTAVGIDSLTAVTASGAQVVVANGGTLALESNASGANRNVVIGGNGAAGRSGALELVSGSSALSGTVFINGSTRIATRSGAGTLSIGAITAEPNGPTNGTLTFAADSNPGGNSIVVEGAVSGAGAGTLAIDKQGAGTVSLQGNNTNIGSTNIRQGTLEIKGDNLGAGSTLTIGNGRGQVDDSARARLRVESSGAVAFGGSTVTLDNGILDIRRGSVNMSGAVITGTTVQPFVAGLSEGRITGTFNIDTATQNPGDFGTQLSIRKGQTNVKSGDPNLGWGDNETWVYTGQVYTDTGFLAFAENIDDRVWVRLNGNVIIDNGTWNDPSASGSINLGDPGWYDIEIRMQNGGGGAGAVAGPGWTTSYGFGMSTAPGLTTGDENGGSYSAPVAFTDSNSMPQVFRVAGAGSGKILIGDGGLVTAELVAAGLAGSIEEVRLNGSDTNPARLALVDRVSFQNNAIDLLTVQGFATLDIGANQQLTVGAGGMTTSSGLTLTKTGSGSVVVNGAAVLGSAALIDVQAGNVTFNGGLNHLAGTSSPGVSGILVAGGSTVTVENNFTFGGVSTFTKGGAGVLRVNGTNDIADGDFFGPTVIDIQGGSLYLNGAAVNAGFGGTPPIFAVNSGATFGGRGGVRGDVVVYAGGTFSSGDEGGPGAGSNDRSFDIEGSLLLGGVTASDPGSIFSWNLNSLTTADAGVEWDRVNVNAANGSVDIALATLLDLNFGPGLAPDAGDSFWQQDRTWSKIINVTSGTGVNTSTPQDVFTINNSAWSSLGFFVAQVSGDGQGVDLVWNFTVIPEPASVVLTAVALAGAVLLVRRRSSR